MGADTMQQDWEIVRDYMSSAGVEPGELTFGELKLGDKFIIVGGVARWKYAYRSKDISIARASVLVKTSPQMAHILQNGDFFGVPPLTPVIKLVL